MNEEIRESIARVQFFYDHIADVVLSKVNNFTDAFPMAEGSRDELLITATILEMTKFLDSISDSDEDESCEDDSADENEITKKIVNAISEIIGSKPEEIKIVKGDDKIAEVLNMIKKDTEAEKSDSSAAEALRKMLGV